MRPQNQTSRGSPDEPTRDLEALTTILFILSINVTGSRLREENRMTRSTREEGSGACGVTFTHASAFRISSLRSSSQEGRQRVVPKVSTGSSTAKPGPVVATS